jgi:hypothetical protein
MSTTAEPKTRQHLEDFYKSLSPEDRVAMAAMLGAEPKTPLPLEVMEKALDRVEASLKRQPQGPLGGADATELVKGLDGSLKEFGGDVRSLVEALRAMADLVKGLKGHDGTLATELATVKGEVEKLTKAVAQPLPGQAITGAAPVPHPLGENAGEGAVKPPQLTRGDLIRSLMAKWEEEKDASRRDAISQQVGILQVGGAANVAFCKSLGIKID